MSPGSELFLAWRYFKPKRSAVSFITLISVVGVMLGVAVLIVVLAVMTGFTDHLKEKLLETGSHGQIRKLAHYSPTSPRGTAGTFDETESEEIVNRVRSQGGDALPLLVAPVLLQVENSFNPKGLVAFRGEKDPGRVNLATHLVEGTAPKKRADIAISGVIANEFNLRLGDKILLHAPGKLARLVERDEATGKYKASENADYYLPGEFTVCGIYNFGKYDFDRDVLFMGLDDADELFGLEWGEATYIYVWVPDPFDMKAFSDAMARELQAHPNTLLQTWQEIHSRILGVLAVEKNMMFFLLIFIVLVAAFSITNTMITTVIQKTREIGLLKAMGASSRAVMNIFLMQGLFVGVIGTSFGVLFGWLVVEYRGVILDVMRHVSGQQIFPREVYMFDNLPAHIIWSDVALISVISVILCTCGALLPALRASQLDPAKALRYE